MNKHNPSRTPDALDRIDDIKAILALVEHAASQAVRNDTIGFQLAKAEIERRLQSHVTPPPAATNQDVTA